MCYEWIFPFWFYFVVFTPYRLVLLNLLTTFFFFLLNLIPLALCSHLDCNLSPDWQQYSGSLCFRHGCRWPALDNWVHTWAATSFPAIFIITICLIFGIRPHVLDLPRLPEAPHPLPVSYILNKWGLIQDFITISIVSTHAASQPICAHSMFNSLRPALSCVWI